MYLKCMLLVGWWLIVRASEDPQDLDSPYCAVRYRRLCQGKGRHVACQFPTLGPGESCLNYTLIKFTKELRHFVTHYINRRRQRIAAGNERVRGGVHLPKPEVMMQVEWDRELALLAQRLANQCHFVHDDCRATVRYPYAGQTVGEVKWRRSTESEQQNAARAIRRVLDAWWGEKRRVTAKQLTQPFRLIKGTVWGHFSQLAVWTLRAVGCGAVRHGIRYPRILLVCDFSHTNMLGQRTLVPGPVSPCPIHTARRPRSSYPLLCASVRHIEQNPSKKSKYDQQPEYSYAYEPDFSEDDELYDISDEGDIININPSPTSAKKESTRVEYITEGDISETKDLDSQELSETQNYRYEIYDEKTVSKTQKPRYNQKTATPYIVRKNLDDNGDLPKGFISRDEDINSYNNVKSMVALDQTHDANINNYQNLRNKAPDRRYTDATMVKTTGINKEQAKLILKMRQNEQFLRRLLQQNALRSTDNTNVPRFMQKLEQELIDRESTTPAYNTRWLPDEPYLRYRTRDWTVSTTSSANILDFSGSEFTPDSSSYYDTVRQRWRPTRDRPDRPGARALIENTIGYTSTRPRAANKKASSMAMKMDKDDVEQLFLDTGYKPGQRKILKP